VRTLAGAVRTLQEIVRTTQPGSCSGDEAREMVGLWGEAERAAASAIALLSPRVIETGSYAKSGHPSAPDWLAAVAGSSASVAKGRLAAAERAAVLPELRRALLAGRLSSPQLQVVAAASSRAPEAVGTLLEMVTEEASHQELSAAAAELKACARSKESERIRRARVHRNRHFRWHQDDDGGIVGSFSCDEVAWARIHPTLEAATRARWKAAGAAGGESFAAHRMDALIDLLACSGAPGAPGATRGEARPQVLVLIDAEALRRGTTATGEICEIAGIGPVPVEAAVELLGQGAVQFLVKEGQDIATVTRSSRDLAQKTAVALWARDRVCVVPGCGKQMGLQGDHCFVDYSDEGPTELANLALLCPAHHDMKTHGGWKITGKPGKWMWIPPARPPSAGAIARTRRVAAAKATRNRLRQT